MGSARARPIRKVLVTEKSRATWPPLGPRGTQMSAGRREAVSGSGGSGSGRQSSSVGSRGIKRPGFWKSSTQICSVVGGRVNDVPIRLWRVTPSPPHLQAIAWSPHLSMNWTHRMQLVSWDRPRRLTRNKGVGMRASTTLGSAKSQAPAPGRDLGKGAPGDGAPGIQDRASAGRPLLRSWWRGSSETESQGTQKCCHWEGSWKGERNSVSERRRLPSMSYSSKAKTDAHAELLGWGQAGDMCGWRMLHRAASADATGDTEAS